MTAPEPATWADLWDDDKLFTFRTEPWPDPPCIHCGKLAATGMCDPCYQAAMEATQRSDLGRLAELNTEPLDWGAYCYARAGIPVLALQPGSKLPATRHGVDDATTDTRFVRSWWRDRPDHNIGLATGHVFDVIDIDVKAGAPGLASMEKLRRAGLLRGVWGKATTPTGGLHLLVAPSGDGNHSAGEFGIDYRGRGGYIVASASALPTGSYRWEWADPDRRGHTFDWQAGLRALGVLKPAPPAARVEVEEPTQSGLLGILRAVASAPEGKRNNILFWGANRLFEKSYGENAINALMEAARICGLDDGASRRTIESARRTSA